MKNNIQQKEQHNTTWDRQGYLSLLKVQQWLLICIQSIGDKTFYRYMFTRTDVPDCGSDGGLAGVGTMGFAIMAEDTVLWKESGPVYGDSHMASSRQSELLGFAGYL
jgi:hypothetical protein